MDILALLLGLERTRSWWIHLGKNNFEKDFSNMAGALIEGEPLHPYWIALQNWQSKPGQ